MSENKLTIKIDEKDIDSILEEFETAGEGIVYLHKWVIPHWDWLEATKVGCIKVNPKTAEYMIDRLKNNCATPASESMFQWVNYGFSVRERIEDWRAEIDFTKLVYKT